jgi:hypothetical protein
VVVIRAGSAADAAPIAAVQREAWFAAYTGIIPDKIIDRVTTPDDGARVRQSFRTRPWQRMIVATPDEAQAGVVGYASFGPETDVLGAPWPHPLSTDGEERRVAELYALYVRPAWWSTGTGRGRPRPATRPSRCGCCGTTSAPGVSTSGPGSRQTAPPTCSPASPVSSNCATTRPYNQCF